MLVRFSGTNFTDYGTVDYPQVAEQYRTQRVIDVGSLGRDSAMLMHFVPLRCIKISDEFPGVLERTESTALSSKCSRIPLPIVTQTVAEWVSISSSSKRE